MTQHEPVLDQDIPLDQLSFGFSPRDQLCDPAHVEALAEVLAQVPPIVVHAPTMKVIDGVHRVLAARARGHETIRAALFHGSEPDAFVLAVYRNVAHGRPLTLPERQEAATRMLDVHPEWSDRRVAELSGLSPKTVARVRIRSAEDRTRLRIRVGRDGKAQPIDPAHLRRLVAQAIAADPHASIRAIALRSGSSQGTVRDVKRRLASGEDILPPRLAGTSAPRPIERPAGSSTGGAEFASWFAANGVDDRDVRSFVDAVPISRVYEVADEARRRAEVWRAFATDLEDRVRRRRERREAV